MNICSQPLIRSDAGFLLVNLLFSVTNGYTGTICQIFAPKMLQDPKSQVCVAKKNVAPSKKFFRKES